MTESLKPKITWYVRKAVTDKDQTPEIYKENNDFYAGSYTQEEDLAIEFHIWNNRFGKTAVNDLNNFGITVQFDYEEDSALLQYMQFQLNGAYWLATDGIGNIAKVQMQNDIVISGAANTGEESAADNYIPLKLVLTVPKSKKIKLNDLKTMTLSISQL